MNRIDEIIKYEQGELSPTQTINLFKELITDKSCWSLQGHYGRMAQDLINSGIVTHEGEWGENFDPSWHDLP